MCVCVCALALGPGKTHSQTGLPDRSFLFILLFEMTSRWTGGGVLGDEGEGMEKRGREE